jgi:putative flippase GtrA
MRRLLNYTANGLVNTVITYGLYLLLVQFIDYRVAIVIVYCVGIIILYYLHGTFVFGAPGHFGRFVVIYIGLMLVNMLLTWIFVSTLQWPEELAQVPSIAVVFLLGFALNQRFVYSGARK